MKPVPLVSSLLALLLGTHISGFSACHRRVHGKKTDSSLLATVQQASTEVDNRPHEQRAKAPRAARRLNHPFRYLYRHDNSPEDGHTKTAEDYLRIHGGYTKEQLDELYQMFPPMRELDVQRHLKPKMRFLKETILGMNDSSLVLPEEIRRTLPPHYYGARLERIVAPRHAFLVHLGLYNGRDLLHPGTDGSISTTRWQDFLQSCRNTKKFAALCQRWATEKYAPEQTEITSKQIEAFDIMFGRGLMAAARDYLSQQNNTWANDALDITCGEMIQLLVQHGANPLERDNRGVTLLHWAAGTGNLDGVKALTPYFSSANATTEPNVVEGVWVQNERDGATPLHWSAAGADSRQFGVGGHLDVCQYLLSQVEDSNHLRRDYVCQVTKDGNSPLMWAAWSGTLDTVKFLIRNRADPLVTNRNGCTVAHWASSGGNLEVCKYLADVAGVDFLQPNYGGNTPLSHAVAFGRAEVVEWLRRDIVSEEDDVAAALALDFVDWTDGQDVKRQEVLKLFEDWIPS